MSLDTCEVDARAGGSYRFVFSFGNDASKTMAFFGNYVEVTPHSRLVWTNDEGGADARSITTVTFEEHDGKTRVVVSEVHASKEALEDAAAGAEVGMRETLDQLDELVATLRGRGGD